jgi:predicted dehydrogenase
MNHRIVFAGFRHPHILSLWKSVHSHPSCQLVGAWEADANTREQLRNGGEIALTHDTFASLLADSGCDIVAIGDVYARRGALAIEALSAGKHIISDKPLCTTLAEWETIRDLAAQKGRSVGCQLDLRENGAVRRLRQIIAEGQIGRVCTLNIQAQHPLRPETRAAWYFEPGQHGGTINDIGIHSFDLVPWLIDTSWEKLLFAHDWNAKAVKAPHFKDCAQFLARLENGASCFADLSYLAPNTLGFDLPHYWRITVHGTAGMAEASYGESEVLVVSDADTAPRREPALTEPDRDCLGDFLDEIEGRPSKTGLTTESVLTASRLALEAQQVADGAA